MTVSCGIVKTAVALERAPTRTKRAVGVADVRITRRRCRDSRQRWPRCCRSALERDRDTHSITAIHSYVYCRRLGPPVRRGDGAPLYAARRGGRMALPRRWLGWAGIAA